MWLLTQCLYVVLNRPVNKILQPFFYQTFLIPKHHDERPAEGRDGEMGDANAVFHFAYPFDCLRYGIDYSSFYRIDY